MKIASSIAALVLLCALGAFGIYAETTHAREPDCPSSWSEAPAEQFLTASEGVEWFVIRSADSNGYETVRAYRADDRYQAGYVPGSPDEVCYLLVRRPGDTEDLAEPRQPVFRAESEDDDRAAPAAAKTLFRQFYDRLIPAGPYGPNPDPKWGDLFVVFSSEERSCMVATLGEGGLAEALTGRVFREGEPRARDVIMLSCLSDDMATALAFAIAFGDIVRRVDASGEENPCVQELLRPAVAALSNPSPTDEERWSVIALFFGLESCGLKSPEPPPGVVEE